MLITRKRVLFSAAGAMATGIAALWALGSALSAPAPRQIGAAPRELRAETVSFPSDSGSLVQAWLGRGVPGRGAVVLAHSVRSNRREMIRRAIFLLKAGYSVLLFDAQAHGETAGEQITFGYLESRDARAAVAFLRSRFPTERVGYLGISQGGAAALLGPLPIEVQALVLEAVYSTLREAVVNRIAIRLPFAEIFAPLLLAQVELRLGIDPDVIAPIEGMRHIRAPLLLIAGEEDRRAPLSESRRLFDAAPEPKALWIVPGATHQDFHRFAPAEYERRVLEFLARTLGGALPKQALDLTPSRAFQSPCGTVLPVGASAQALVVSAVRCSGASSG